MVANYELFWVVSHRILRVELLSDHIFVIDVSVCYERKTNSNNSLGNEVHFDDFFLLIVNNLVFVMEAFKFSWHEPKRDIVHEFSLVLCPNNKKSFELAKNVREKVDGHNLVFGFSRKRFKILVVSVEAR